MNNSIDYFSKRLKELRHEKGLSIQKLSKITKLSSSSISRWENGQADIKSNELIILAKFFGVTTDFLLGIEN